MEEVIMELGKLCKVATELERKWDHAGKDYLGSKMTHVAYEEIVRRYLDSVRRLESALSRHLVALSEETARDADLAVPGREQDHRETDA